MGFIVLWGAHRTERLLDRCEFDLAQGVSDRNQHAEVDRTIQLIRFMATIVMTKLPTAGGWLRCVK